METGNRKGILTRKKESCVDTGGHYVTLPTSLRIPPPIQAFVTPFKSKFDNHLLFVFIFYDVLIDILLLCFILSATLTQNCG